MVLSTPVVGLKAPSVLKRIYGIPFTRDAIVSQRVHPWRAEERVTRGMYSAQPRCFDRPTDFGRHQPAYYLDASRTVIKAECLTIQKRGELPADLSSRSGVRVDGVEAA